MQKLAMHTSNIADQNFQKLAILFPQAVTESVVDGEVVRVVDKDVLMQEIGAHVVEGNQQRYQFTWPDKAKTVQSANQPLYKTLRPYREESVNFDTTENLYIEGDNLEVLKLLQETYLNKVKMIYIDPPYNTGNDFVYNDKFSIDKDDYDDINGSYDDEGNRLFKNTESNGRFHTDWLNMMYPRLKVARDLLSDDGVIFMSIDDNEVHNLRKIADEIFGADNFLCNFVWEKRTNRENRKIVSYRYDNILCFCKSKENSSSLSQLPMTAKALANYKNPDNDTNGLWKSDPATAQAGHGTKSQFYTLVAPNGKIHKLESGRCWIYTQPTMEQAIKENKIWFGKDGNGVPRVKTYLHAKDRGLTPETIIFAEDVSTNEIAKNKAKLLFNGHAVFETPKPETLITHLLRIGGQYGTI